LVGICCSFISFRFVLFCFANAVFVLFVFFFFVFCVSNSVNVYTSRCCGSLHEGSGVGSRQTEDSR
jgi:hypothetical protein